VNDAGKQRITEFSENQVVAARSDVTNGKDVSALLGSVEAFGGVDVLMNNAVTSSEVTILDMTDEQSSYFQNVALTGRFRCLRAAARRMAARGACGAVVNNASYLGWQGIQEMAR
jgi:3-oxoacyl-[acyl-carrier protein] reductase